MMKSYHFSMALFLSLLLALCGCESSSTDSAVQESPSESGEAEKAPLADAAPMEEEGELAVFQDAYARWRDAAIASGEFCSEDKCAEEYAAFDRDMSHEFECMIGIVDQPVFLLGELNGDGLPDAVAQADWSQCDGGNALHTAETWLVFLSQADGSYVTIEDPMAFGSMDIGGVHKIAEGAMLAEGLAYHDDDPRCCPSISWDVEYRVVDGNVVETKISEKVREEMD